MAPAARAAAIRDHSPTASGGGAGARVGAGEGGRLSWVYLDNLDPRPCHRVRPPSASPAGVSLAYHLDSSATPQRPRRRRRRPPRAVCHPRSSSAPSSASPPFNSPALQLLTHHFTRGSRTRPKLVHSPYSVTPDSPASAGTPPAPVILTPSQIYCPDRPSPINAPRLDAIFFLPQSAEPAVHLRPGTALREFRNDMI